MELGRLIIEYLMEIVKIYLLVFGIFRCIRKEGKIQIITVGSCVLILSLVWLFAADSDIMVNLNALLTISAAIIILKQKKQIVFVIVGFCSIAIIDTIVAGLASVFLQISVLQLIEKPELSILINSISLFLFFIGATISKRIIMKQSYTEDYNGHTAKQVVLVIVGLIAFAVYMVPVIELGTQMNERRSVISIFISSIIFLTICFISVLNKHENQLYKKKNEIYELLFTEQKIYYEAMLKREGETKKFRHDINNHLLCIQQLVEENKIEKIKEYLGDLVGALEDTGDYQHTGNKIIDIVVKDIWKNAEGIILEWKGIFPETVAASDMDLCILFSNMLKNAVRSTAQYEGKKIIEVNIKILGKSIFIKCENPIGGVLKQKKGKLYTTKKNTGRHGFGLQNMQDVVKRYGGDIHYETKEKFIVEIILEGICA